MIGLILDEFDKDGCVQFGRSSQIVLSVAFSKFCFYEVDELQNMHVLVFFRVEFIF